MKLALIQISGKSGFLVYFKVDSQPKWKIKSNNFCCLLLPMLVCLKYEKMADGKYTFLLNTLLQSKPYFYSKTFKIGVIVIHISNQIQKL